MEGIGSTEISQWKQNSSREKTYIPLVDIHTDNALHSLLNLLKIYSEKPVSTASIPQLIVLWNQYAQASKRSKARVYRLPGTVNQR